MDNAINYHAVKEKAEEHNTIENKYFQAHNITFINIARLSIEKDQEKLIKAFKEVHTKHPNTQLLILGEGPLKQHLENLINALNLNENVFLLGRISNPFPYLKQADCFVMSSNHEGQGLAMLEAMILKKPIISTNFSCAYDVLDNGKYGLIVENSQQALVEAMEKFIAEGLYFEDFDYEAYNMQAIKDFYCKVCGD